jgi:hypothetical protein
MSELGRELMRGVVVGTGKRLDVIDVTRVTGNQARLEEAQRVAHIGYSIWNLETDRVKPPPRPAGAERS